MLSTLKAVVIGALAASAGHRGAFALSPTTGAALAQGIDLQQAPPGLALAQATPRPHPLEEVDQAQAWARVAGSPVGSAQSTTGKARSEKAATSELRLPGRVPAHQAPANAKYRDIAPLMSEYAGEETGKFWGTKVEYLNTKEREKYMVSVKNGLLHDARGKLVDTQTSATVFHDDGRAIFVMDHDGKMYVQNNPVIGKFQHSSFLAGQPVAAAGEIRVENGVITLVTRNSGHYHPSRQQLDQAVDNLKTQGVPPFTVVHEVESEPQDDEDQLSSLLQAPSRIEALRDQAVDGPEAQGAPPFAAGRKGEDDHDPSPINASKAWSWPKLAGLAAGTMAAGGVALGLARAAGMDPMERKTIDRWLDTLSPDSLKLVRIVALEGRRYDAAVAQAVMGRNADDVTRLMSGLREGSPFQTRRSGLFKRVLETIPENDKILLQQSLEQHRQPPAEDRGTRRRRQVAR